MLQNDWAYSDGLVITVCNSDCNNELHACYGLWSGTFGFVWRNIRLRRTKFAVQHAALGLVILIWDSGHFQIS